MQKISRPMKNIWQVRDTENCSFCTVVEGSWQAMGLISGQVSKETLDLVNQRCSLPLILFPGRGTEAKTVPAKVWDLGGIHVETVPFPDYPDGCICLLIRESRLLIAGDAFEPPLELYQDGCSVLDDLEKAIVRAKALSFDRYLEKFITTRRSRAFLTDVLENVRRRQIDWDSWKMVNGTGTYYLRYEGSEGVSRIPIPVSAALEIKRQQGPGFNTRRLHGTHMSSQKGNRPIHTPVYQTSAFAYDSTQDMADAFAHRRMGYSYTRIGNPTVEAFEQQVTELEGGAASVACASGMAAVTYALLNILSAGDEFISGASLYGGTIDLFRQLERFGLHVRYVDPNDREAVESAINEHTKLIFAETLGNPSLTVTDIAQLASIAHRHGLPLIVDNTMASAYLVRPLSLGADIVVNSSSKYINGTGNGISGIVTDACRFSWDTNRWPMMKEVSRMGKMGYIVRLRSDMLTNHGGCLSPQNAHLNLLGLETMGIRMERECGNAMALARHLSRIPGLTVNYPGLEGCPGHKLAKELMTNGYGTVLTLRVGSRDQAIRVMDSLKLASIVSNVGDIRTMVVHPASTMALHSSPQELEGAGVYEDLIRISVGIENIGDLIADFDQALMGSVLSDRTAIEISK